MGYCPRQLYLGHLGLRDASGLRGRFKAKHVIQAYFIDVLEDRYPRFEVQPKFTYNLEYLRFVGQPTCYDPEEDIVYHVKTRDGWYKFHPPNQRHIDQLTVYLRGLDAARGRLLYVSMTDFAEMRMWPPADEPAIEFDTDRFDEIAARALSVREEVVRNGIAIMAHEIPFPKCGCFLCESEQLRLPDGIDPNDADDEVGSVRSSAPAQRAEPTSSSRPAPTLSNVERTEVAADTEHVPRGLRELDYWVLWDGRKKIALAPWEAGTMYPVKWGVDSGIDPRRDFQTAQMVAELPIREIHRSWPFPEEDDLPASVTPALLLPHDPSELVFVDFDDVRDPETGEVPTEVANLVESLGGYTEISHSGTGLHTFVKGRLPESTQSFSAGLEGPGRVEMYDSARFIATTWQHVPGTPLDETPEAGDTIRNIIADYARVADSPLDS